MLTPRLEAIAKMVEPGVALADIGTDHGYLPLDLLEREIIPSAIAADVNEKPLASARRNTPNGLKEKMQFRLGNGLEPIRAGEVDQIVIAGMGGELISEILSADWDKTRSFSTLILQPMVKVPYLRKFLKENGFVILDEIMVQEGSKFYQIIKVAHGQERDLEPIHMEIGAGIIEKGGSALMAFLEFRISRIERILVQLEGCGEERLDERSAWIKKRQELLEVKKDVGERNYSNHQ